MRPEDVSSQEREWTQWYAPTDHYEIGREEVRQFARSMKSADVLHWDEGAARERGHDGLLAPGTFTARMAGSALNWLLDNVLLEYDSSAFVQTDQVFTYHRPLHAGDKLSIIIGLRPIRQKAGGDTICTEGLLLNHRGELVQSLVTTAAGKRGAQAEPPLASALADVMMADFEAPGVTWWNEVDAAPVPANATWAAPLDPAVPSFDDLAVGDALPPWSVTLRRGDLVNYSGISADYNPIHWSERVTKVIGLDTTAAHGMLTMGIGSTYLSNWLGDPAAVRDYRVRFTGIAYVADDQPAIIEYTGRVKEMDEESRTATIAIGASFRGKRIFGRATAVVALR